MKNLLPAAVWLLALLFGWLHVYTDVRQQHIGVLSVVPLFGVTWKGREQLFLLGGALLFLLPLYVVSIDWGRWIHIYVFGVFCIVLAESAWVGDGLIGVVWERFL